MTASGVQAAPSALMGPLLPHCLGRARLAWYCACEGRPLFLWGCDERHLSQIETRENYWDAGVGRGAAHRRRRHCALRKQTLGEGEVGGEVEVSFVQFVVNLAEPSKNCFGLLAVSVSARGQHEVRCAVAESDLSPKVISRWAGWGANRRGQ